MRGFKKVSTYAKKLAHILYICWVESSKIESNIESKSTLGFSDSEFDSEAFIDGFIFWIWITILLNSAAAGFHCLKISVYKS